MPRGTPTLSALVAARVNQDTPTSQLPTHDRPDRYFDLDTVLVKLLNTTDEPGETQPQAWVYSQSSTQSNWTRHTLSLKDTNTTGTIFTTNDIIAKPNAQDPTTHTLSHRVSI